ncbi:alpha/beta fold hydrolase [Marinobacter zhejiangensis]|uniref:Pimeloyl-ACP methyl ester carboxylesterase n=1 Tax=Marinobacter zhejiangensis TaxID=488535 RepID=A0A1I4L2H5_9GAMM|nr:alpha/beta hydrolase [Marinobacter zhejiangensis]SFL85174.1 Pimeloyl-ACP methyl ester carboxylesterase [Marinobacter zhejiangensis]
MRWILLRGLAREQAHWGSFLPQIREAFPDHQFFPVDLPGTGVHFKEASPTTIADIRRHVQAQVAHIPKPYSVLALSLGGMVALDWAQHVLEGEIQQLVLINTSSGFSPPWQRMKPGAWPRLLRIAGRRDLFRRERDILSLSSNLPISQTVAKQWYSIQRQRPVTATNALRQIAAAARFRPGSKRPLTNALLLTSAGDRLVDWRCSQALESRWQWTLKRHPDAGHDLPLDDTAWIIRQLRSYLDGE